MTSWPAQAAELIPLVASFADRADAERRLPAEVAGELKQRGLYRIAMPERCGGAGAPPRVQFETIETLSRGDGSAGWNLMIGMETFGLIAPWMESCREVIADPRLLMCSSTANVGRAEETADGWRISGRWKFVSGCQNAEVFGATVARHREGQHMAGLPNCYAILTQGEFSIDETWDVAGMRGSGSHDVVVEDVVVPQSRMVLAMGNHSDESALMRFPLASRLAYNKVAVALGIARAALDEFVALAGAKKPRFGSRQLRERPFAQRALAEAEVRVRSARALVLELLDAMWAKVQQGEKIALAERALFQIACSDAVRGAIQAVDTVAEAAGTSANFRSAPLERRVRDVRVVGQHVTVAPHQIEDGGRVLLGLEPEGPLLKGFS